MTDARPPFPADYFAARDNFRTAATRLGWELQSHPVGNPGPDARELTTDVAVCPGADGRRCLLISSGLHGVEGFFGSAVQRGLLDRWAADGLRPACRVVFVHALNPFGFASLRRADRENIDPNRNFLLPGQPYAGSPAGYAPLDGLLNPRRPPSACEPFTLKALLAIARHGMPALKQAIATGQYDFPRGLFYGGPGPCETHRLLEAHLPEWVGNAREVIHLDFHTGLGRRSTWKLLLDAPPDEARRQRLEAWSGPSTFSPDGPRSGPVHYDARGGLGDWCVARFPGVDYLYACAEFGTYGPIAVLGGLRAENQARHWGTPADISRAGQRLKELFCPAAPDWRTRAFQEGCRLVCRALDGLAGAQS